MNVHYEVRGEYGPAAHCLHPRFKLLTKDKKKVTCRRCLKQIENLRKLNDALMTMAKRRIEHTRGRATANDIDWFGGA